MNHSDTFWQRWWSILCTGIVWRVHSYCHQKFLQGSLFSERKEGVCTRKNESHTSEWLQQRVGKLINKWQSWTSDHSNLQSFSQWCENELCKLLYLLEAEEDLSQLSLHTKGWLQRPPVDPIIFTPRWGSVTAECKRKAHTCDSCDKRILQDKA